MRFKFYLLPVFLGLLVCTQARAQESKVHYTIRPVPAADRTVLHITANFKSVSSAPMNVKLPADGFGTPDIHKYVTAFEGTAGTKVEKGSNETERIVIPDADGTVSLSYTISYDPVEMDKYPYAPNTGPDHFHVAGCQWMLRIGDSKKSRPISVEISGIPKNWRIYSSIDENAGRFETVSSYSDLMSTAIGGGEHFYSFQVKGKPVSVFVHGKFDIPNAEIYSAVERIVKIERNWFGDHEQPFYHVVVAPRSGVTAGYAPKNAFINFVRNDISRDGLNLLFAHEMFHFWLPNKIKIVQDEKYAGFRYEWFFEGFTDYFAPRILLEAGLLRPEGFADLMNKAVRNIADNPHRGETYDDFVQASQEKRFNSLYKKLSYHRGALIALNWNTRLLRRGDGRDLADFIRGLFDLARKTDGKVPEQAFFAFAESFGIDAKADMERYIHRAEPIKLDPSARIGKIELHETEIPLFEPGFSIEETRRSGKVSGVVEGGPAYSAGLRNGMIYLSSSNAVRSSNSWRSDQPLIVVVKADDKERRIEFFPYGKLQKLRLFQ